MSKWAKFLQVSRSGYYDWLSTRQERLAKEAAYKEKVKKIFGDSGGTYGPDRMYPQEGGRPKAVFAKQTY